MAGTVNIRMTKEMLDRIEKAQHKVNQNIEEVTGIGAMFDGRSSFIRWLIVRGLDKLELEPAGEKVEYDA